MSLEICNITKSFDRLKVLENVNLTLEEQNIYCLMGASGSGKTTLFRIILGLEHPDSGLVKGTEGKRFSAVFQENRLCEAYTPLENVLITAKRGVTAKEAKSELCRLLPEEAILRPVFTLSGGMKRRTAICRAVLACYDILLMDEPFTGLDEITRQEVICYIREKTEKKLVILSTHQEEDVEALGAKLIRLK
ncbi:MAG: ATP-binding cassette domain-containing protein [Hungatella sp.]|nr:ATP-binding cassette domain-containing protein [Hungatella sp.]